MSEGRIVLSQEKAKELIEIGKKFLDLEVYEIPLWEPNHKAMKSYPVCEINSEEQKRTYLSHTIQLKGRTFEEEDKTLTFVHEYGGCICRLDYGKHIPKHINPDGKVIDGPHLHYYTEKFDVRYALPLDDILPNPSVDSITLIKVFLDYCNISFDEITFMGNLL